MEGAAGPDIILVGVVHGDPEGYDKLKRFLERVRPRVISVEISEYSWRYRRRHTTGWQRQFQRHRELLAKEQRRHLALEKVAAQIADPFEVRAAQEYAREHGVAWRAVDTSSVSREHLPRYEAELLGADNLRNLVSTPDGDWGEHIRQEYQWARKALATGQGNWTMIWTGAPELRATMREKVLAHRVARLAKQWLKVVHVGGWEHLVTDGPEKTMADYLVVWSPQRVLLDSDEGRGLRAELKAGLRAED